MEKKSMNQLMGLWHRDVGFFIIGMVIIYALSGIILIFRDSNFLKHKVRVERTIAPNLEAKDLKKAMHRKELNGIRIDGENIFFEDGQYNKVTGIAAYTTTENIFPFNRFIDIHKSKNKGPLRWISAIFGLLLLFMVFSSLWMFKKGTTLFRRGIIIAGAGLIFALLLFFI
jgi:hypothetical protein